VSSYSRIFHHITVEEVKRSERDRNLLEKLEEFKEEEIIEPVKHIDWRKDVGEEKIEENMETTGFMNIIYPSMADTNIQTLANGEEASYSTTTFGNGNTCAPYGDAGSTPSASSLNANGTGTGDGGDTGNFDVGAGYAFIPLGAYGGDDNDGQLNLAPVDAREYDTIVVQAQVGDGTNGGRAPTDSYLDDPNEIGFGGLMVSYYLPQMDNTDANTDSWSLDSYIEKYEPGYSRETDPDYTDNILPLWRDALPEGISQLREYSILIPPWAQKENVTFNVYGIGPLVEGTGIGGDIAVKNVYFRRLQPVSVVASLDSPAASAFIHDGAMSSWKGSREKKRRELARQMKQSNIYLEKKFGPGFPGTGALPPGENQHGSRSWREAQRKDNPNFPRGMESRADHADSVKDHRGEPLFPEGYRTWYTRTGGRAAPGSHDSYRMQMVGRTPGVKYTTRKQSISTAPRSRTAADIKRDFAAGKHIPDPRHREKYVKATQEKQRQAQYQRSLTKWKSDVGQWEKKTGMVYDYETGTAKSAKPSPSVDKGYKVSQKGGGFIQNLSSGERVQLGQSGIDAGEIEKVIDNGLPPEEMEVLKQKGVPDEVLRKAENAALTKATGVDLSTADLSSPSVLNKAVTGLKNFWTDLSQWKANIKLPTAEYSANIAKSILMNRPITVKQSDIPARDIRQLMKNLGNSYTVTTSEQPYADENIYYKNGKAHSNIGPNGEKAYYQKDQTRAVGSGGIGGYGNPLAAAGQAQSQLVIPRDGSEPYYLYTDHAYHNTTSDDPGEVPDPIKTELSRLTHIISDRFHGRDPSKGKMSQSALASFVGVSIPQRQPDALTPNTGGMKGYSPNIRGDVKTQIRIPYSKMDADMKKKVDLEREYYAKVTSGQIKGRHIDSYTGAPTEERNPQKGEPLSEKKSSLKSPNQFFNPADIKPEYPDEPPPELTKRGYHPDLEAGEKVSNRYNKLDPISARSMPKTGNPHIDRKVAQAAGKKKLRSPKEMREGLTVA